MWLLRQTLSILVDHVTNTEKLRTANTNRQIRTTIHCRKFAYLRYKYQLLQFILNGKIERHRGPQKRQQLWFRNIRDWRSIKTVGIRCVWHRAGKTSPP